MRPQHIRYFHANTTYYNSQQYCIDSSWITNGTLGRFRMLQGKVITSISAGNIMRISYHRVDTAYNRCDYTYKIWCIDYHQELPLYMLGFPRLYFPTILACSKYSCNWGEFHLMQLNNYCWTLWSALCSKSLVRSNGRPHSYSFSSWYIFSEIYGLSSFINRKNVWWDEKSLALFDAETQQYCDIIITAVSSLEYQWHWLR